MSPRLKQKPAEPTVSLQIRMSPDLMRHLVEIADLAGVSRSQWIRLQIAAIAVGEEEDEPNGPDPAA